MLGKLLDGHHIRILRYGEGILLLGLHQVKVGLVGVLPSRFCLVDTWFSLIDSKEVTVYCAHVNIVVNHTLCVLMVVISIHQKPRFLPFFWSLLMSGAWHQLRLKCVVCKDRLSVQEKLSFDCWCKGTTIWSWKQIFGLQIF